MTIKKAENTTMFPRRWSKKLLPLAFPRLQAFQPFSRVPLGCDLI
jgi:hypothetical protein